MENIIEIEHLSKSFGEVKAVQDLSFRVKEGELFAFRGNGRHVSGSGRIYPSADRRVRFAEHIDLEKKLTCTEIINRLQAYSSEKHKANAAKMGIPEEKRCRIFLRWTEDRNALQGS